MSDELHRFETYEELIEALCQRADDFEALEIPVPATVRVADVDGKIGGLLRMCGGGTRVLDHQTVEMLLNDGLLSRLRLPVKLVVPRKTESDV